jgi:hypothetical protein
MLGDWSVEALALAHAQMGRQKPKKPRVAIGIKLYIVVITFSR